MRGTSCLVEHPYFFVYNLNISTGRRKPMAIITVSGGIYSGGKELAAALSEKLSYRLVSQEQLLPYEAGQMGVPGDEPETALAEKFDLIKGPRLQRIFYTAYMQVAICEDAKKDGVVYHSQAAHLLLRGIPHHLGIRMMADMEHRIASAMKYRMFNYEKASDFIRAKDEERNKWARAIYHVKRNDPSLYDIVFKSPAVSTGDACDMVVRTIQRDIRTTPESTKAIDDLILAAEIRTRIALDRNVVYDDLEVEVHDGKVTLRGTLPSSEEADRIRTLILKQPGVREIESRTSVRW